MIDAEKVIKDLEFCVNGHFKVELSLATKILALLKEQDAVKPKKVKGYNPPMYTIYEYECEKCKSPMMNKQPFCMGCGQAVKWE